VSAGREGSADMVQVRQLAFSSSRGTAFILKPPPASLGLRSGRGGQFKIHLFFEAVHFENLHRDLVAQLDDAAGAAAYEMVARLFEHVKIILDR